MFASCSIKIVFCHYWRNGIVVSTWWKRRTFRFHILFQRPAFLYGKSSKWSNVWNSLENTSLLVYMFTTYKNRNLCRTWRSRNLGINQTCCIKRVIRLYKAITYPLKKCVIESFPILYITSIHYIFSGLVSAFFIKYSVWMLFYFLKHYPLLIFALIGNTYFHFAMSHFFLEVVYKNDSSGTKLHHGHAHFLFLFSFLDIHLWQVKILNFYWSTIASSWRRINRSFNFNVGICISHNHTSNFSFYYFATTKHMNIWWKSILRNSES